MSDIPRPKSLLDSYRCDDLLRLHQATIDLSRARTLDELARRSAELAVQVLGYDRADIWFPDSAANIISATCESERLSAARGHHALSRAYPAHLLDEFRSSERPWLRLPLDDGESAEGAFGGPGRSACAPVRDGDATVGVICVDNRLSGRSLRDGDCDLLALYASAVGPLWARCRAEDALWVGGEATLAFQGRLFGLHRATTLLSACSTVDELCRRTVELGHEYLGFVRMGLWFLDTEGGCLRGSYGMNHLGELQDERGQSVAYDPTGDLYRAERERQPWTVHPDRPVLGESGDLIGTTAIVEAPVWDGERVVGCIYADNHLIGPPLSDHDCDVVALYAGAVGHLLGRVRGEETLRTSAADRERFQERLIALHALTTELSTCGGRDELHRKAVELGHERFGRHRLGLWMLDASTGELVGTFGIDEQGRVRDERSSRFKVPADGRLSKAQRSGFRWDLMHDAPLRDGAGEIIGQGSWVCVPVWDGNQVTGALFADNLGSDQSMDERECEVLALYASSLGHLAARFRAEEEHAALELKLQHAQKMESVGRLAGGVAHDFNNLLTSLLGNVSLATESLPDGHPARPHLDDIQKAGEAAAELTRQLLAFSRKQVVDPRVIDLNQVVAGTRSMLRRLIGEDVDLRYRLADGAGTVRIDPGQLEQVLVNLAVNGRDAMPAGGVLTIQTERTYIEKDSELAEGDAAPGLYLVVSVADTGVGMDQQALGHVFEPFFTTKEQGKGTGLGLATVYGIVTQNKGFVTVHSQLGHGSAFRVYLPRVGEAPAPEQTKPASAASESRGTETILLVEDEAMVRELAAAGLRRLGYTVLECEGPNEAMRTLETRPAGVHLLLTDVIMPEMNGRDLSVHVKRMHPEVNVLFMSGYAEDIVAHSGVLEEEVNFIGKPFRIWQLAAKVREVLDA